MVERDAAHTSSSPHFLHTFPFGQTFVVERDAGESLDVFDLRSAVASAEAAIQDNLDVS